MKFAYADPPYLGTSNFGAAHHYGKHHDQAADYDGMDAHVDLVARLVEEFPDGWAMSASSPSLKHLLALCPPDVRVMAWIKPFASFKPGVNPGYCWEPIIVRGGRKRTRKQRTTRDWVAANITLKKGLSGVKPIEFCFWLFEVLNLQPGDELVDIFPGTRAVSTALSQWFEGGVPGDLKLFGEAS